MKSTFISLVTKTFNYFIILPITYLVILIILRPLLYLLLIPIAILRLFISIIGPQFDRNVVKLVTPQNVLIASDNVYKDPKFGLVILTRCRKKEGFTNLKFKQVFQTEFEKKNSDGKWKYPELKQYFSSSFGFLFWKWEQNYNFENHFRFINLPKSTKTTTTIENNGENTDEFIGEERLYEFMQDLVRKPFPPKKSPWELIFVENYKSAEEKQAAGNLNSNSNTASEIYPIIFRFHHGMADGFALHSLIIRSLRNYKANVEMPPMTMLSKPTLMDSPRNEDEKNGFWKSLVNFTIFSFISPYDSFRFGSFAGRNKSRWFIPGEKLSRLYYTGKSKLIPLAMIKEVKNSLGVSFTAVVMGAVAEGIREAYLKECENEKELESVDISCSFLIPFNSTDTLGNNVIVCQVRLPLEIKDSIERIRKLQKDLVNVTQSTIPLRNYYYNQFVGLLPVEIMRQLSKSKNILPTMVFSNYPGPTGDIGIDFVELNDVQFEGGMGNGSTGLGAAIISNNGSVQITIGIDRALTEDPNLGKEMVQNAVDNIYNLWSISNI